jgi:hypothetical protein
MMKQGRPDRNVSESAKREPRSRAVSVDKVANIGLKIIRTQPSTKDLYNGRGYMAPGTMNTSHPSGSQGKRR